MYRKIKEFEENMDEFKEELKEYLTNEDLPLDDRWAAYSRACSCGIIHKYDCCYYSNERLDDKDFNPYDDLGIDRYQSISFVLMIECLNDCEQFNDEDIRFTMMDILKNDCTSAGWMYDW